LAYFSKQKTFKQVFCLVLFHQLSNQTKPNGLVNGVNGMVQKNAEALDWHRADVVAELKKKGTSVRKLSIQNGLSPNTLKSALQFKYPKGERIIAAAIGVKPEEIWPSRYEDKSLSKQFPKAANA
jgi:Ner family transcriptional regulator